MLKWFSRTGACHLLRSPAPEYTSFLILHICVMSIGFRGGRQPGLQVTSLVSALPLQPRLSLEPHTQHFRSVNSVELLICVVLPYASGLHQVGASHAIPLPGTPTLYSSRYSWKIATFVKSLLKSALKHTLKVETTLGILLWACYIKW